MAKNDDKKPSPAKPAPAKPTPAKPAPAKTAPVKPAPAKPAAPLQKPGEKPAKPGEYIERGPKGGEVSKPRQVTMDPKDTPLPPTKEPNRTWERTGPPKPDDNKKN